MWKAIIENKNYTDGKLTVVVVFTNDKVKFAETIDLTGGSVEVLNQKITSRLNTLNASETFETQIPMGDFVPAPMIPSLQEEFFTALRRLETLKRLVNAEILTDADQVYVDALALVKKTYDPTFIN